MRDFTERFWCKVQKAPGCWLWTAQRDRNGYGRFQRGRGVSLSAHRVSWEIAHGPVPAGLQVLHRCDTPACVNPEHLFIGTNADNRADMIVKGRAVYVRGDAHPCTKLTAALRVNVLLLRGSGLTQQQVAERFGVDRSRVSRVWNGAPR